MIKEDLPKVAVLLAAYNGVDLIAEQVETILNQSLVALDLYVSIDLSTDDTFEFIQSMQVNESRIHLLQYGERYGGAAKNFFRLIRDVNFSKYDYVALADQDDVWLPNKLVYAVDKIKSLGLDAYSSDVIAFWSDGKTKLIKKSYPRRKFDFLFEAAGPGCTYVFKVDSLNLFKEFLIKNWAAVNNIALHDWLIYAFFRARGFKWHIDFVPLMRYRQHANNQVGINSGLKAYAIRLLQIQNKWYRSEVEKIAILLGLRIPSRSFILKNFFQLRRRTRDAFVLLAIVILGLY